MAGDFKIDGAKQLAELTRKFRSIEDKTVRRELSKSLTRATKRSKDAIRASAREKLPKRGGLAASIAASRISVRNKTASRIAVLQLVTSNKHNIRAIDRGIVRHPVYGNRKKWATQKVPALFWTAPMRLNTANARRELAGALDELQRKLSR